jgi:hypothetical protein
MVISRWMDEKKRNGCPIGPPPKSFRKCCHCSASGVLLFVFKFLSLEDQVFLACQQKNLLTPSFSYTQEITRPGLVRPL